MEQLSFVNSRMLLFLTLCLSLLLAGCGSSGDDVTGQTGQGDLSASAPLTSLRASALAPLSAADTATVADVLSLLSESPDPDRHDALVVDAGGRSDIASETTIQAFLVAGKPVLFLHVNASAKAQQLSSHCPGWREEASYLLSLRRGLDRHGRAEFFVYDWPADAGQETGPYYQQQLAAHLQSPVVNAQSSNNNDDFNPPPGLLYVTLNYAFDPPVGGFLYTQNDTRRGTMQWPSVASNYVFRILLENSPEEPQGKRQWLVVSTDVQANPINPALGTTKLIAEDFGGAFKSADLGWFQTAVTNRVTVDTGLFQWQADSPANTISSETVLTQVGFSLSFNTSSGGGGTFNYLHRTTKNLTDWAVDNLGAQSIGHWVYGNQDPYQHGNTSLWASHGFGGGLDGGTLRHPNSLSLSEFQGSTEAVWTTTSVLTSEQTLSCNLGVTYGNAWAGAFSRVSGQESDFDYPFTFTLDMSSVLPVAIESLTFDPNPALVSQTSSVTATVTLASPAKIDTVINLSSSIENAAVLPSVTVKQGETSANFQVLVNANQLTPGEEAVATITAFSAQAFQNQLTIQNN